MKTIYVFLAFAVIAVSVAMKKQDGHPVKPAPGDNHPVKPAPGDNHPVKPAPGDNHPVKPAPGDNHPVKPEPGDNHPVKPEPGDNHPVKRTEQGEEDQTGLDISQLMQLAALKESGGHNRPPSLKAL